MLVERSTAVRKKSRCMFLDRDGVVNKDIGYAFTYDQIEYIDGLFPLSRLATSLGYKIVIITNQSGIGRGFYTDDDFLNLMEKIKKDFLRQNAQIDGVYFSPFHPTKALGSFRKYDPSRKPGPGMIIQAEKDLSLDLANSVLIGDKMSDIYAGLSAGVGTNILLSCTSVAKLGQCTYQHVNNLQEVEWILLDE